MASSGTAPPLVAASTQCSRERQEKLSPPQKRRRRLQRAAVRHAITSTSRMVSDLPFLNHVTVMRKSWSCNDAQNETINADAMDNVVALLSKVVPLLRALVESQSRVYHSSWQPGASTRSDSVLNPEAVVFCPHSWNDWESLGPATAEHCNARQSDDHEGCGRELPGQDDVDTDASGQRHTSHATAGSKGLHLEQALSSWEPLPFFTEPDVVAIRAVSKHHVVLLNQLRCRLRAQTQSHCDELCSVDGRRLFELCSSAWPGTDARRVEIYLRSALAYRKSCGPPTFATRTGEGMWRRLRAVLTSKSDSECDEIIVAALDFWSGGGCHAESQEPTSKQDCHSVGCESECLSVCSQGEGEDPEFSHVQLHSIIDLTAQQLTDKCGLPTGFFSDVAAHMKQSFPCDSNVIDDEPVFSRSQVKTLIDIIVERCEHSAKSQHVA